MTPALALVWAMLAAAVPSPAPAATLAPPTDAERAAYDRGRSYERVVLANVYRSWYGIAVLHARFSADIDVLESGEDFPVTPDEVRVAYEPMRAYLENGDASKLPKEFAGWNALEPYSSAAKPTSASAWFVVAGMADVAIRAADDELALQMMAVDHPKWLADNAALGGAFASELGTPGTVDSEDHIFSTEHSIETNFEAMFPARAFVSPAYPPGLAGDAQIGVAMSTINELLDSPALLAQPESQAFVDAAIARMKSMATSSAVRDELAGYRGALVVDSSFDHDAAYADGMSADGDLLRSLPTDRRDCVFFGTFAAQIPYDAVAFRDPNAAAQQLGALKNFDDFDATDPKAAQLRAQLSGVAPTDWTDELRLGRALVDEIESIPTSREP
jgi:hypothetical protein